MSFKIISNKGKTASGSPLFLCKDAAGNTFLASFFRLNGSTYFRYYRKSEFAAVTPANGVYAGVGYYKNDLTVDPAIVAALTLADEPDGVAIATQAGLVSTYFPEITNTAWVPVTGAVDTITLTIINASGGGGGGGSESGVFILVANGDGSLTVKDVLKGDKITIDGGTAVIATDVSYTSPKLKDGTHTVVVTSGTSGIVYSIASKTVTTKVLLMSAPLDWVTQNPAYAVGIGLVVVLILWFVVVPLFKGEPILGGGKDAKKVSRSSSKRRYIDLN